MCIWVLWNCIAIGWYWKYWPMVCCVESIAVSQYTWYMGYSNVYTIIKQEIQQSSSEIAFIAMTSGLYKPGCPIFIG